MQRILLPATLFGLFGVMTGQARVVDDFSEGGWTRFPSTPGTVSLDTGMLHLKDGPDAPAWVTVSKTFTIDVDRMPLFVVKVSSVSDRGTVKLIRRDPYDKRVALEIDRPGLYALDMRSQWGWQGPTVFETCLYAIGDEEEITYAYVGFTERLTREEEDLIANREAGRNARLKVKPFEIVPLFNTCSFYFESPRREDLVVHYREDGGPWLNTYDPVYVKEDGMYRGSVVNLKEDTPYELRITAGNGDVLAQQAFRTWQSRVPIAKTITLDETSFKYRLTLRESGSPQGWIKITARKGFVLRNDRDGPLVDLDKAKYVLLEGLTLRGGLQQAIAIRRCQYVRVVNCDIAGWGRLGTQRFDLDGKYYTEAGEAINWDSAILVSKSLGTVVERCYIHDPVSTANSWYYSHPAGPEAVGMDKSPLTVLRYNDFIGSDTHRWNDAVEGSGNFHVDGGFDRDGDVYGNMMCFANDDALEIDGGQTNVRVFLNKFEGCLCGVSIQGCMSGPSYVFRNLMVNMGDERGLAGQTIKTSSHANGPSAVSFIFNNTCHGESHDLSLRHNLRIVAKNNVFAGRSAIAGRQGSPQSECDYNLLSTGQPDDEAHGILGGPDFVDADAGLFALRQTSDGVGHGVAIDNFATDADGRPDIGAIPFGSDLVLPLRPIPITLDRYQLSFSARDLEAARTQSVLATVQSETFSSPYRIAQNDAFDWFDVTPKSGTLASGRTTRFAVTLLPEKMTARPRYRGAFLIRLESGYSRPVMVYAKTDVVLDTKRTDKDAWVTYLEAEEPEGEKAYKTVTDPEASQGRCLLLSGPDKRDPVTYQFSIPKTGKYFLLLRVKSEDPVGNHDSLYFGMDDGSFDRAQVRSATSWGWSLVAHNSEMSLICLQSFELAAGEHAVKLAPRESMCIDLVAMTDNPGLFD